MLKLKILAASLCCRHHAGLRVAAQPRFGHRNHCANTYAINPQYKLVAQAGLSDTLKAQGPFTVFAPSDEAFKAVPAKTLEEIAKDPARLKAVLTYHVVAGKTNAADIKNMAVKSVNGADLALSKAGDFVTVEDAAVQTADIAATNGVVHIVDRVLIPPRR